MTSLRTHITNLLTLRYDPNDASPLPTLSWRDFVEYDSMYIDLASLLAHTIKKVVGSSTRVGMGISGGIDTSLALALLRKIFPDLDIRTYCLSFGNELLEQPLAGKVAVLYHTRHKPIVIDAPFKMLAKQVKIAHEPRWNLYGSFLFEQCAKDGCDLVITGDGADELFGGYVFRYAKLYQHVSPRTYMDCHERDWVPTQHKMTKSFDWNRILAQLNPWFKNPLKPLGKVFLADYNGKLARDFAPTSLVFAKYYRVPIKSPFLEPELIYAASHLPCSLKYDPINQIGKILLRNILLLHSGFVPATGGKIGFGMNWLEMWDTHIRAMCEETLLEGTPECAKIINRNWISLCFTHASAHDIRYIVKMLGILATEFYLRN